jgi:hypothetical protein
LQSEFHSLYSILVNLYSNCLTTHSAGKLTAEGGKWKSFNTIDSFSELPPTNTSTPGGVSSHSEKLPAPAGDKVFQSIPGTFLMIVGNQPLMTLDFDSMRLRIDSLSSEKEFLMNENSLLTNRLNKVRSL